MRTAIAVMMAVCLWSGAALAQGGRFDGIAQSTTTVGAATVVVPLPGATITVCSHPATGQTSTTPCTNKATTYTDATLGSACSTSTQVVLAGTSSCVAAADPQGNYGYWVPAGGYDYSICASGVCSTPNYAYVGLQPTSGTVNVKLLDNVTFVDNSSNWAGVDMCANIHTALLALPATGGTVDARFYQGNQACASNPFLGVTAPFVLLLGNVTIQPTVQWTWNENQSGSAVLGAGFTKSTIQYTGGTSLAAFWQISSTTPSTVFVQDIVLRNLTIRGNANVTDALLIKGTHRSFFDNLSFKDATGCGFHTQFAVANSYFRLRTTAQDGVNFVTIPACGVNFDQIDSSHQTTAGTVIDLEVESVIGIGIRLGGAASMVFTAGTSEGNIGTGFQIDAASNGNRVYAMDLEANTVEDFHISGSNNHIFPSPSVGLTHLVSGANYNELGGEINKVQIDSGATYTKVDLNWDCQGTGTFSDAGAFTQRGRIADCANGGKPLGIPYTFRDNTTNSINLGTYVANPVELIRGAFAWTTTPAIVSNSAVNNNNSWRLTFIGYFTNSTDGAAQVAPAFITEATAASPTVAVGTQSVTFNFVAGGLQATASAGTVTFVGTIFSTNNDFSNPATTSILMKNSLRGSQFIADQGTACTNGELALSAGWQSTGAATVTAAAGTGQTCSWTITTGTTTAANPTITDTLTNALPGATTVCWMNIYGGTHTAVAGESLRQTTLSATAPIFTANFTPTAAGTTYFVTRGCGP